MMGEPEEKKTVVETSDDNFDQMLKDVINDSGKIDDLSIDDVMALRKKISPYGQTIAGEKQLCCLSVINMREEYIKKFQMTSLIAFLFRGADEYKTLENEPVVHLDDMSESEQTELLKPLYRNAVPARAQLAKEMKEDAEIIVAEQKEFYDEFKEQIQFEQAQQLMLTTKNDNGEQLNDLEKKAFDGYIRWEERAVDSGALKLREEKMKTLERMVARAENMTKRVIIREFLNSMFTFNPDVHVRGAYGCNPLDPERKEVKTSAAKKSNKSWKRKSEFARRSGAKTVGKHQTSLTTSQPKKVGTQENADARTRDAEIKAADDDADNDEWNGDETLEQKTAMRHIPPADLYLKWNIFNDDNFEQIRSTVQDLYHEKPDIEFAINPYGMFPISGDAAKQFVKTNEETVIWNIETLHSNNWNLIGSFAKNRERTDFLNKNTGVITEYLDQVKKDKELGRELMMKKAQRKKIANVGEAGPDSKAFRKYKTDFADVSGIDLSSYKTQAETYTNYQIAKVAERERLAGMARDENGNPTMDTTDLATRSGIDKSAVTTMEYPSNGLDPECGDDQIQVDVIQLSGGGSTLEKSNFFSDAVEPSPSDAAQ